MHRIDTSTATSDNRFTEGDPTIPIQPTVVSADWLNAVQEEIAGVVTGSGLTLSKDSNAQLLAAVRALGGEAVWNSGQNYSVPCVKFGSDGALYLCLQSNGPGVANVGAKDPADSGNAAYWASFESLYTVQTSVTPAADIVPKADADGKLAAGWIPAATDAAQGIVERATDAEALAGTDTTRFTTPKQLRHYCGSFVGDIRFLPFRANALPDGWYFMNGELYTATGGPGKALLALPQTFRTDWGIALSDDGTTVNVPDWFADDGRGPIMQAVNGTSRQLGTLEQDGLPNIMANGTGIFLSYSAPNIYDGAFSQISEGADNRGVVNGGENGYRKLTFDASKSNSKYGGSSYVTMLNRGMTPAIFLGV